MSLGHVTKSGCCVYCGAKLQKCIICYEFFYSKRKTHLSCSSKCRTRKHRILNGAKIEADNGVDSYI